MKHNIQRGKPTVPVDSRPTRLVSSDNPDLVEEARRRRFTKAMAMKDAIGLTKDERYSLAQMLPTVDKDFGGSWKDLNPQELHDLITMMEGWIWITHMIGERNT
jgi:hypothetical protein